MTIIATKYLLFFLSRLHGSNFEPDFEQKLTDHIVKCFTCILKKNLTHLSFDFYNECKPSGQHAYWLNNNVLEFDYVMYPL